MKKQITSSIVLVALACAAPVAAQDAPEVQAPAAQASPAIDAPAAQAPALKPVNLADMRHHIYVMEGALARAVDYGAKQLNREISAVMPGAFMLEGEARARGVHLDSYGVFFDVRVPTMRQSMAWSLQVMLGQDDAANRVAIDDLRRSMQGVTDPATRAQMEKALRQLERQVPAAAAGGRNQVMPSTLISEPSSRPQGAGAAAGLQPPAPAPSRAAADSVWAKDPDRAYTEAVTRALVDAMIDYSTPMNIPAEQWLTVAARDDEFRDPLAPQDPLEEVVTMIYRVKGSDLQLYRTGKIDRDEVRKRVQVTQF
jgi:hypothetical protein